MMRPEAYRQARLDAPIHAQMRVVKLGDAPVGGYGACTLTAHVERIFRDTNQALPKDKDLDIAVEVFNDTVDPKTLRPPRLSGALYKAWSKVSIAKFVEVYLQPASDGFKIVHSQIGLLDEATETPACPPESTEIACPDRLDKHQPQGREDKEEGEGL
jgi:hypothetical protein